MSTIETNFYSDHDMQDPGDWYGGFKEGRVIRFGDAERSASHIWTGDWQGSTYSVAISDYDRSIRQRLHSAEDRFWVEPLTVRMTTRANRAALGVPYVVFVGPIIEVRMTNPLGVELTLGDIVAQGLLSDEHQIPWRKIGDGFLSQLVAVSQNLDREAPEPIIYGEHRRVSGSYRISTGSPVREADPPSQHGFQYVPTYLGIIGQDALGSPSADMHVWLVAGHACADLPDVLVWTPEEDVEGLGTSVSKIGDVAWVIPHDGAPAYEDLRSDTYGNDRRYTLIRALVGDADADACAIGEKTLTVFVDGVEPNGDGTGEVIVDRIQQYEHFLINFVANYGPASYQAGPWLSNPTWSIFGETVAIVDESSFDACTAIAELRLPGDVSGSPLPSGYIGAAILGATSGDRSSVRRWLSDWNRSCGLQFAITRKGRIKVFMLHPTQAAKDAADLYTASYEILRGSFGTDVRWQEMANRIPFQTDYDHAAGVWTTVDVADAGDAITNYGRAITGELRSYPMAPGITMAYHLARIEALVRKHPMRYVQFEATVGPSYTNASLAYREIGDYVTYEHFDAVGSPGQIRLAQIVRMQVQTGKRRILAEALDCEDLIDYDASVAEPEVLPSPNDTCAEAIVLDAVLHAPEIWNIDTTLHEHDTSLDGGSPPLWSGTSGYHAAWWRGNAPVGATKLLLTTVHSLYDTQLAAFTGACGALTEVDYQDNDGVLQTSVLDIDVTPGTEYYVLVAGYGPNDGGSLTFSAQFYNQEP